MWMSSSTSMPKLFLAALRALERFPDFTCSQSKTCSSGHRRSPWSSAGCAAVTPVRTGWIEPGIPAKQSLVLDADAETGAGVAAASLLGTVRCLRRRTVGPKATVAARRVRQRAGREMAFGEPCARLPRKARRVARGLFQDRRSPENHRYLACMPTSPVMRPQNAAYARRTAAQMPWLARERPTVWR